MLHNKLHPKSKVYSKYLFLSHRSASQSGSSGSSYDWFRLAPFVFYSRTHVQGTVPRGYDFLMVQAGVQETKSENRTQDNTKPLFALLYIHTYFIQESYMAKHQVARVENNNLSSVNTDRSWERSKVMMQCYKLLQTGHPEVETTKLLLSERQYDYPYWRG